jgi:HlyD family secretion protein
MTNTGVAIRKYEVVGFAALLVLIAGFGGWAVFATIGGAVMATGQVVVESNAKQVQHLEGGLVSEILVREGDWVEAGDVLLRIDGTETRAQLGIVRVRSDELTAKRARLEAERDGADSISFPESLRSRSNDPEIAGIIAGQTRLFAARRETASGQRKQLHEKIAQLNEEISGLEAQDRSKETQGSLISSELADLTALREQGLVPASRVLSLQREAARLEGESGQLVAQIARIRGQINETRLQILQIDKEARTEVLNELREVQALLSEMVEKRVAAEARLYRIDILAPQSGLIHQLAVHTVGGVIGPGQELMRIVPEDERLVVEARLAPRDIDQVVIGQAAVARFSAFDQNTTPEMTGVLRRVAADLSRDEVTGQDYYSIRIEFEDLERFGVDRTRFVPGMPAEVFIPTGDRTPLNYLLKPLSDQIARAFRES